MKPKTPFEERLKENLKQSQIDPAFANRLHAQLNQREHSMGTARLGFSFRWSYALITLLLAAILVFSVGPNKVLAQLQTWLGFVPGAGLVSDTSDLRVLAEPVSQTRDGITVRINKAIFSPDKSNFDVEVLDIPFESHFSQNLDEPVCNEQAYLLLPDGTKLMEEENFAPIPTDVSEATYVIPCFIMRTRAMVPENWQIPIRLVNAPADLSLYPYELPNPGVTIQRTAPEPAVVDEAVLAAESEYPVKDMLDILLVVEKPESWLIGYDFLTEHMDDYHWGNIPVVIDANGKQIAINWSFPEWKEFSDALGEVADAKANYPNPYYGMPKAFELPKGDYAFPLTITQLVTHTRYLDLARNEELFSFDAGSNPQPGDVFEINKTIQLGDYEATVLNAYVDDQVGFAYRFNVDGGEDIFNIDLHLLDYEPALGVSKSTAFTTPYLIDSGVAFGVLPTGMLRVGLIQGPQIALGTYIARGTWSPEPTN